jgi:hypothetical protein
MREKLIIKNGKTVTVTVTVRNGNGKGRLGTVRDGRIFLMDGTVTKARRNGDGTVTER